MAENDMGESKGRRVTIDLSGPASKEVERLRCLVGLTTADVFRHALSLFRIYVEARERGEHLYIVNPADNRVQTRIELPVIVSGTQGSEEWQTNPQNQSK